MKEKLTLKNFIEKLCCILEQHRNFNELNYIDKRRFLKNYTFRIIYNDFYRSIHFYDGVTSVYRLNADVYFKEEDKDFETCPYSYLYNREKRELFNTLDCYNNIIIDSVNKNIYITYDLWSD